MTRSWSMVALMALVAVAVVIPPMALAEDEASGGLFGKKEEPRREPLPWEVAAPGEETCHPAELVLLRELRERSRAVDAREKVLMMREQAATELEQRLAEEVVRIDLLRAEMTGFLDRASGTSAENIASLSKMLDVMKANDAAQMLAGMDVEVVLQVLRSLKPKQAAKVLAAFPPEISQSLGDRFTLVPDPRGGVTERDQK